MLFLIGFGLTVAGGVMIILYLNLIPAGLSWTSYLFYIISQTECQLFVLGLVLMLIGLPKLLRRLK
ncbi:hypothetical protein [Amphibacillus sediminis]|uniref:hypothetical protein n=1 Tax=Amphibacillus sediminis TaxID=360185 RepID=UPI00082A2AD6|nr:hypothetical protein [Amphibacillus sediminis]